MPVDPLLQPILDMMNANPPPDVSLPPVERRRLAEEGLDQGLFMLSEDPPEVASVVDHRVPVDGGEITVRVYTPEGDGPFPCYVYFHGGGWFMGRVEQFDTGCQEIAVGASCVVASVDYRLAPEHKFPIAAEDCYAGLLWVVANADELRVDASRLAVGGASAGGNLAAVVSLMNRDRGGPPIALQVLEIAVTDLATTYPSMEKHGEGYGLTAQSMEEFIDYYLADPADAKHPYASPMFADDHSGLPAAVVTTMEFDPLRDDGEAYAARLADAGVPTVVKCWDGHIHLSCTMTKVLPTARTYREEMIGHIAQALGTA
jgi:acetyl esterase